LKPENKDKKLSNSKTVAQLFPLIMKSIEVPKTKKDMAPGTLPPITIAPKKLIISLAETHVALKYESFIEGQVSKLKNLEKNPTEGFKCNIIQ